MVVGEILTRNARKFPDKVAVVHEGRSVTYRELNERVNRLANALLHLGLKKGERVGVLLHNCPEFVEVYFACAKSGAIFCPYNNHLKGMELKELINYSSPRFLFVDPDFLKTVEEIRDELPSVEQLILLGDVSKEGFVSYDEMIGKGEGDEPGVDLAEGDVMSMIFTAGTTGRPKGALRTHKHVVLNAMAGAIELQIGYDEVALISFPMYHVAGEDNLTKHILMSNTLVLKREGAFRAPEVLDLIEKHKVTMAQFVPTMIHRLVYEPKVGDYDLSSLRMIVYAAAPMPVSLLKQAMKVFSGCRFAQLYGQTESGPLTTVLKPEDHVPEGDERLTRRLASCGRPVVTYELRIVDEEDRDVPIGEIGEIIVRSEAMMKGYWQMPEETEKKLKGGWLHTGDLGRFDEDGYVYLVERKDDMIISGGVNIYPREIEEVLYMHPAVSEACVVGVPDEHWGEVVRAVVVLKEGKSATEEELKEFCSKYLANFKVPKAVEFWQELPKSPQGKVLKRVVRQMLKERLGIS